MSSSFSELHPADPTQDTANELIANTPRNGDLLDTQVVPESGPDGPAELADVNASKQVCIPLFSISPLHLPIPRRKEPVVVTKQHIATLRTQIFTVQLDVTLLKSQRAADRDQSAQYEHELAGLRKSVEDLCDHLQRLSNMLDAIENNRLQLSAMASSSSPGARASSLPIRICNYD